MKRLLLTTILVSICTVQLFSKGPVAIDETATESQTATEGVKLLETGQSSLIKFVINTTDLLLNSGDLLSLATKDSGGLPITGQDSLSLIAMRNDSIQKLIVRLKPRYIEPTEYKKDVVVVVDTLKTESDAINVLLFNDNTWRYVNNRDVIKDSTIFVDYWDTQNLMPYKNVDLKKMSYSVVIDLIDSLKSYHYPYKGKLHPRGKFGPRRGRRHMGVDMPLKMGSPIYATFDGRVRISSNTSGGYGQMVIIRHDNGLETYYAHLSQRNVKINEWVEAGQVIGLGGSTGRSTGPHLHYEIRYYGQAFDPERLIDFEKGLLCRETFLLKKTFFSIYSKAPQNFEDEVFNEEQDKKDEAEIKRKEAELAARKYYRIRSGDTLGHIAVRYGTNVGTICRLNGIKSTAVLALGKTIRVR